MFDIRTITTTITTTKKKTDEQEQRCVTDSSNKLYYIYAGNLRVQLAQTRLVVAVAFELINCPGVQSLVGWQTLFEVRVGTTAVYCKLVQFETGEHGTVPLVDLKVDPRTQGRQTRSEV